MFEGFFNKEAKDESLEASINTGRMAEGITEDISEEQEKIPSGNERFDAMKEGIGAVMDQYGIRAEEAMGQEDFFMEKLQENGVISAKDMSLSGIYETVKQAVKEVARKRLDKKDDDLQNRKIA